MAFNRAEFYIAIVSRETDQNAGLREAFETVQLEKMQMLESGTPTKSTIAIVNM